MIDRKAESARQYPSDWTAADYERRGLDIPTKVEQEALQMRVLTPQDREPLYFPRLDVVAQEAVSDLEIGPNGSTVGSVMPSQNAPLDQS